MRIIGTVTTWPQFGHDRRFLQTAFDSWLRSPAASCVRLSAQHRLHLRRCGPVLWRVDERGLHAAFRFWGRGAALAVRYGFLPGLAAAVRITASRFEEDRFGTVEIIESARIVGLSLTAVPSCPGALVKRIDGRRVVHATRRVPRGRADRQALREFLEAAGLVASVHSLSRKGASWLLPAN